MGYLLVSAIAVFFFIPVWIVFPIGFLSWNFPNLLPKYLQLPRHFRTPLLVYVTSWLCIVPLFVNGSQSYAYLVVVSSILWFLAAGWVQGILLKIIFAILFFLSLWGHPTNSLKEWSTKDNVLSNAFSNSLTSRVWT